MDRTKHQKVLATIRLIAFKKIAIKKEPRVCFKSLDEPLKLNGYECNEVYINDPA